MRSVFRQPATRILWYSRFVSVGQRRTVPWAHEESGRSLFGSEGCCWSRRTGVGRGRSTSTMTTTGRCSTGTPRSRSPALNRIAPACLPQGRRARHDLARARRARPEAGLPVRDQPRRHVPQRRRQGELICSFDAVGAPRAEQGCCAPRQRVDRRVRQRAQASHARPHRRLRAPTRPHLKPLPLRRRPRSRWSSPRPQGSLTLNPRITTARGSSPQRVT